jgi:hypothetical protein
MTILHAIQKSISYYKKRTREKMMPNNMCWCKVNQRGEWKTWDATGMFEYDLWLAAGLADNIIESTSMLAEYFVQIKEQK